MEKYLQHVCLQKRKQNACRAKWGGERYDNVTSSLKTSRLFIATLSDQKNQKKYLNSKPANSFFQ